MIENKENKEKLTELLKKDSAVLKIIPENYKLASRIFFTCKCGNDGDKIFSQINKIGAFCKKCTQIRKNNNFEPIQKKKDEIKTNTIMSKINSILKTIGGKLLGTYDIVKKDTILNFVCKCDKEGQLSISTILKNKDALCKECRYVNIMKKTRSTMKEKYGSEYSTQINSIREKIFNVEKDPEKLKNALQKRESTNLERYGVKMSLQSELIKDKSKKTLRDKYGVENPSYIKEVIQKRKDTCLKHFGFESATKSEIIKEKIKNTCLERYGTDTPLMNKEIQEKIKNTCLEKYGVDAILKSKEIIQKRADTNIKKYGNKCSLVNEFVKQKSKSTLFKNYGVFNSTQSPIVQAKMEKSGFNRKEYTMPSGKIVYVQGYEPFALDELVKIYEEENIKTTRLDIPTIKYNYENNEHVYFPDIYIKSLNKIIEVKSTWTYSKFQNKNTAKFNRCKELGYAFECWVYKENKTKEIIY